MTMTTTLLFQHMKNTPFVVFGRRNVGKTYYMLKMLEEIGKKRPIH